MNIFVIIYFAAITIIILCFCILLYLSPQKINDMEEKQETTDIENDKDSIKPGLLDTNAWRNIHICSECGLKGISANHMYLDPCQRCGSVYEKDSVAIYKDGKWHLKEKTN